MSAPGAYPGFEDAAAAAVNAELPASPSKRLTASELLKVKDWERQLRALDAKKTQDNRPGTAPAASLTMQPPPHSRRETSALEADRESDRRSVISRRSHASYASIAQSLSAADPEPANRGTNREYIQWLGRQANRTEGSLERHAAALDEISERLDVMQDQTSKINDIWAYL
jgi:hypothetical protein